MTKNRTKRYCYACDLKDDPKLIVDYIERHKPENIWPEITKSIRDAGIMDMQIYHIANRLFMIIETENTFNPQEKADMDAINKKVQAWETLMWKFQEALPVANPGQKWVEMNQIYKL